MAMKNSVLVDNLIEYGRMLESSGSRASMTADRYIVAVIDTLAGRTDYSLSQEDRRELTKLLEVMFPNAKSDYSDIREDFVRHIREGGPIGETVTFTQGLRRAQSRTAQDSNEELTAYQLMRELCLCAMVYIYTCVCSSMYL